MSTRSREKNRSAPILELTWNDRIPNQRSVIKAQHDTVGEVVIHEDINSRPRNSLTKLTRTSTSIRVEVTISTAHAKVIPPVTFSNEKIRTSDSLLANELAKPTTTARIGHVNTLLDDVRRQSTNSAEHERLNHVPSRTRDPEVVSDVRAVINHSKKPHRSLEVGSIRDISHSR